MTITQEKVDNLRSKIKVQLKKEDYSERVKKQLKNLSKQVQIKGFRPGMVPMDMVKRMYGNSVLAEELNDLLNDEVYKFINENKIDIIASPIPADGQKLEIDINQLKDIEFDYEIGHAPEVSLQYIESAPTFTKYKIQVEESMIDEEVMRIRKRFATYEYPETVEDNDILTLTIEELDDEGNLKPGGVSTVSSVLMEQIKPEFHTLLKGLKKQESTTGNIFDIIDRDRESIAKNVLNMNDLKGLDAVGNRFKLTLNNITRSVPAVINEEFFTKVYGEKGPKTEEEMRNNIKAELDSYFDGRTDTLLVNDLYKGVMENIDFPLPEQFLKRWISLTNEKPITQEEIERDYPQFAKGLRWSLIQRKIVADQKIELTDEDVTNRVRTNVIHQLYGYGLQNIGGEWVEQFVQKQLADKKVISQTREQLLEDRVLDYIKSKVKLTEKPISFDEFKTMLETQQA